MSAYGTPLATGYNLLRSSRAKPSRVLKSARVFPGPVEWVLRWTCAVAPVVFWVGFMEISYIGHHHGWFGISQRVMGFVYGACSVASVLASPGIARRSRETGLVLTGVAAGLCVGSINLALLSASQLLSPARALVLLSLHHSPWIDIVVLQMHFLIVWFVGPLGLCLIGGLDAARSFRALRGPGLVWADGGLVVLGILSAFAAGIFAGVWPVYAAI